MVIFFGSTGAYGPKDSVETTRFSGGLLPSVVRLVKQAGAVEHGGLVAAFGVISCRLIPAPVA
jgi:hypothetical protein